MELSPAPIAELNKVPDSWVKWNPPPEPPPVNGSKSQDVDGVLDQADAPGLEADATILIVGRQLCTHAGTDQVGENGELRLRCRSYKV